MGRPRLEKPGQKFGKWTLIEPLYKTKKWRCQCECGTVRNVRIDTLKSGHSLSCGCDTKRLQIESKIKQGPKHELEGKRFGYWTVIKYAGHSKWLCECDCGNREEIQTGSLRFGSTKMCRTCAIEDFRTNRRATTHGESQSKLYGVFHGMHHRCENEKAQGFNRYGGRGIAVCDEWSGDNGYERFAKWAKENGYQEGLEIDRINNDKGYSPDNCRWATREQQANNTSTNRWIEIDGETKTVSQWARYFGIPTHLFYSRYVKSNWTLEETLNREPKLGSTNRNAKRRIQGV